MASFNMVNIILLSSFLIKCVLCDDNFIINSGDENHNKGSADILKNHSIHTLSDYHEIAKTVDKVAMNIDKYIDILVDTIRNSGDAIDPMKLPDVVETFSDKILFVYVDGQFIMRNGKLFDLKNIKRKGNSTIRFDNNKLYIDTTFLFDYMYFEYSFLSKIVSVGPTGYMDGNVRQLSVATTFVFDIFHGKLRLSKTKVDDNVPVYVQVRITSVIDWLANPIINWLSSLYEDKILLLIQNCIETTIQQFLPSEDVLLSSY